MGVILIMAKVSFYKGLKANLPSTGLVSGRYYQCTDTGELYLATSSTTKVLVGPDIMFLTKSQMLEILDA